MSRAAATTAALLVALALPVACSRGGAPAPGAAPTPTTTAPAVPDDIVEVEAGDELEGAPWSGGRLAADAVPSPYLAQWRQADNRATCALLAPSDLGEYASAKPRAANFSGGWAVAYDEPGLRSAFGVAGAGIEPDPHDPSPFPNAITWADGSVAHYGLEGGTGPGHLAYLVVDGQGCLYNVWSQHGEAHLLALLRSLRFVETGAAR